MSQQLLEQVAIEACLSVGIQHKNVPADGEWYSTNLLDSHKNKGNGRIKIFSDLKGGVAFNWVSGLSKSFFINQSNGAPVTQQDREKAKAEQQRREVEQKTKQNKAAKKAQSLWVSAKPVPFNHPYLTKKRIKPYLTRQADWEKWVLDDADKWKKIVIKDALLIPLFNSEGIIRNVQAIFPVIPPELEQNKDLLPKAELSGLFSWVGDKTDTVCIAEGFATMATVHEQTGFRVYAAYTANNLLAVGQTIRKHLPTSKIIFCADNDKSGVGLEKATEAATAVNGFICIPPIEGMDFNDYSIYLQDAKHGQ